MPTVAESVHAVGTKPRYHGYVEPVQKKKREKKVQPIARKGRTKIYSRALFLLIDKESEKMFPELFSHSGDECDVIDMATRTESGEWIYRIQFDDGFKDNAFLTELICVHNFESSCILCFID